MFRREGADRSDVQNRILASWLAVIAGSVNSAGLALVGAFTSHVTGNVGRFASDVVRGDAPAAVLAVTLVLSFFLGAFIASMALESNVFPRKPIAYGVALTTEGTLLVAFVIFGATVEPAGPRVLDAEAALLAAAMGIQNSLVTRLSGAVVRTTHLTGVVTDLGIESARWFRWWRSDVARRAKMRLSFGDPSIERPHGGRISVLLAIAGGFVVGAVLGAVGALRFGYLLMLVPAGAVFLTSLYAFSNATAGWRSRAPSHVDPRER